ncbi:MAG: DUF4838 domain-containing protein [Pirellulaceae bacterium]
MNTFFRLCLCLCILGGSTVRCLAADSPRNLGVIFNGEADVAEPLATDTWHTITASYRYDGKIPLLTNTYLILARGSDLLNGFDVGYHLPTNQLGIVKHGYWNATEGTGAPGEPGKVIENDQGYLDCAATSVRRTDDEVAVSYRIKFKPGVLKGSYNVHQYVEDKDVRHEGFTVMGSVTIDGDAGIHRIDMPREWTNSLKPSGEAGPPLLFADTRVARYVLVIPRDSRPIERKAAADLRHNLRLICGAEFPIVTEDQFQVGSRPHVSIGHTELLANSPCKWKSDDLAAEGYALETAGENVYLFGGSGRGLLHAVYSLLEEDLGCRWYSLTSVDTPRRERFVVSLTPRKFVPVLELRDPYILTMHDPTWSLRNKTNTPHARIPLAWGGSLRYQHMGHTYAAYFPTEVYFAEHPEYYALVNGKRRPSQLCHTNEDVIRLSIEKTCQIFRDNPEVTITAIGPNDGRGFCDCPDCKKLDDENGGRSGSFFYLVNRIAQGVKKQFPHHRIISLAYLDYASPPTHLPVEDNVIIQLCTDSHAWKYQFCFLSESPEFQEIIRAWQAVKATVFIWDYTTDYVHFLLPMANWPVVADNTRFLIGNGATGIMYESELNDVDEMRAWVWAKQLWNPDLDTRTLLHDFIFGYYKESAQPLWDHQMRMWQYWETWHRLPHQCGVASGNPLLNNLQCSYAPDGPLFTPDFMRAMRQDFNQAESLAQSAEILERVKRAKLSLLYLELSQQLGYYTEFGDFTYGRSVTLPRAERQVLQPLLGEFTALCKKHGLTTLGIPITAERIIAKWQSCMDREVAGQPRVFLPAEWIFKADPEDRGVGQQWQSDPQPFQAAATLSVGQENELPLPEGLARLHINRGVGWEQQGFPQLDGFGWYFQNLELPDDLAARKHLYLYFRSVNEQVWVYINGELAFERTYASSGVAAGDLLGAPFSFDAAQWLRPGLPNRVAIRVTHAIGLGGISFPAILIGTDEERTTAELDAYRQ